MTEGPKPTDSNFTIEKFRNVVANFVKDRNWESYHTPKALAEAISIEAGELLEVFLFQPDSYIPNDLTHLTDEMADVFVYIMNLANTLNITNFTEIVLKKIEKNGQKYPVDQFSGNNYSKQ